jgi:hypothetical protein
MCVVCACACVRAHVEGGSLTCSPSSMHPPPPPHPPPTHTQTCMPTNARTHNTRANIKAVARRSLKVKGSIKRLNLHHIIVPFSLLAFCALVFISLILPFTSSFLPSVFVLLLGRLCTAPPLPPPPCTIAATSGIRGICGSTRGSEAGSAWARAMTGDYQLICEQHFLDARRQRRPDMRGDLRLSHRDAEAGTDTGADTGIDIDTDTGTETRTRCCKHDMGVHDRGSARGRRANSLSQRERQSERERERERERASERDFHILQRNAVVTCTHSSRWSAFSALKEEGGLTERHKERERQSMFCTSSSDASALRASPAPTSHAIFPVPSQCTAAAACTPDG